MIYGVILAAGVGKRMQSKIPKQYMLLNKIPVINYSVDKFLSIKTIDFIHFLSI